MNTDTDGRAPRGREANRRVTRRSAIRSAVGLAGGAALLGGSGVAAAQSDSQFGGWFDGVSNYDGVVDMTDQDEVTVGVGTEANGGFYGFGPAAVRISPGTTVVWEWTGEGGGHNVVAEDGTFSSGQDFVSEAGYTYEYTFENEGTYRYVCVPHETLGMKGAVVVSAGDGGGTDGGGGAPVTRPPGTTTGLAVFAAVLFGALASPVLVGWRLNRKLPVGSETQVTESAAQRPVEEVGHDEFDPTGTLSLVLVYMGILAVMWVFMYFVEFLNNNPTVIG
jgi:halocyanin-like protein